MGIQFPHGTAEHHFFSITQTDIGSHTLSIHSSIHVQLTETKVHFYRIAQKPDRWPLRVKVAPITSQGSVATCFRMCGGNLNEDFLANLLLCVKSLLLLKPQVSVTLMSVTDVGVAGWAWSLHGKQTRIGNCK